MTSEIQKATMNNQYLLGDLSHPSTSWAILFGIGIVAVCFTIHEALEHRYTVDIDWKNRHFRFTNENAVA